jgi:hypothetical protein
MAGEEKSYAPIPQKRPPIPKKSAKITGIRLGIGLELLTNWGSYERKFFRSWTSFEI